MVIITAAHLYDQTTCPHKVHFDEFDAQAQADLRTFFVLQNSSIVPARNHQVFHRNPTGPDYLKNSSFVVNFLFIFGSAGTFNSAQNL